MKTPVSDFINEYIQKDVTRLHMPGHKGVGAPGDITEVAGADVLYHASGILAQSQENAARIFGAAKTVYSAEGSSLCMRAMVYLTRLYARRRPVIAACRNAHKTFVTAAALLDAEVKWLYGSGDDLVSCDMTPRQVESFLQENKPDALYLTSPDYLGNEMDIAAIAELCHKYHTLLLVDNAHGAYLKFLGRHPMDLGADMCCDSAHKTLPVLTGGAYLHIAKDGFLAQQAENAMSLFASTSPSYLILRSLDACNAYLQDYPQKLTRTVERVAKVKDTLQNCGYRFVGTEPLKLTIDAKAYGYLGTHLADLLESDRIVCEFSDPDYLVCMITPENRPEDLQKLQTCLQNTPAKTPVESKMPPAGVPVQAMSMHEAIMQPGRKCPLKDCLGKILASPAVSCPPAVPVLVCGEVVTAEAIAFMEYYGIESLYVI